MKSRTLAAKLIQSGRVRVNGDKCESASAGVSAGDTLTISLDRRIQVLRVRAPGGRRGPAEEARLLYEDLSPPAPPRDAPPDAVRPIRDLGSGRPTKRDRRLTDRLTGLGEE